MSVNKVRKKEKSRIRTKLRIRRKIQATASKPRMSVFRSSRYTYAQVIALTGEETIVSASTRDADVQEAQKRVAKEGVASEATSTKSVIAAKALGMVIAEKLQAKNIDEIVFDRNGFLYHGRIKAVADGAREAGLKF